MQAMNLPSITISAINYDRLSRTVTAGVLNQRYTVVETLAGELDRVMIGTRHLSSRTRIWID